MDCKHRRKAVQCHAIGHRLCIPAYVSEESCDPQGKGRLSSCLPGVICIICEDLEAVSGSLVGMTTVGELNNLEERMDVLPLQEVLRK